jgi:hypothetical protein
VLFDDDHISLDAPDWNKLLIPESNNIIVHNGLKVGYIIFVAAMRA